MSYSKKVFVFCKREREREMVTVSILLLCYWRIKNSNIIYSRQFRFDWFKYFNYVILLQSLHQLISFDNVSLNGLLFLYQSLIFYCHLCPFSASWTDRSLSVTHKWVFYPVNSILLFLCLIAYYFDLAQFRSTSISRE